ncbi:hypothetical protein [Candidatus Marinarcus aquaticus]|uniref:Uncharacterized protein n=1 Tax=Candidatus Marinarcus aquaticus TaxID=2044504 RepID=A0A4Q0XRV2_9BACT|nr:hypothetical protein [Candidatus Marinarcus aquaticus]RXJ60086.1 hypothetical protein CRV04_03515 [Candidatus Marinarcus aquaticus]
MTAEEIEIFKKAIEDTILPYVINMNEKQMCDIIYNTPDIPDDFKNMLVEQLFIAKEKYLKQQNKKV